MGGIHDDRTRAALPGHPEVQHSAQVPEPEKVVPVNGVGRQRYWRAVPEHRRGAGPGGLDTGGDGGQLPAYGSVLLPAVQGDALGRAVPGHGKFLVRALEELGNIPELDVVAARNVVGANLHGFAIKGEINIVPRRGYALCRLGHRQKAQKQNHQKKRCCQTDMLFLHGICHLSLSFEKNLSLSYQTAAGMSTIFIADLQFAK